MYIFAARIKKEGQGTWPILIRLINPSGTDAILFNGTALFENERQVHDVALRVLGLPLPELGNYAVDVLIGETPIASRYFSVQLIQGAQPT